MSPNFWKSLAISGSFEQNLKTRSKSIYTRKSHKIDHFLRLLTFLAETEHFEQNMKKTIEIHIYQEIPQNRSLVEILNICGRNWTFRAEISRRKLIAMSYLPKETLCFWPLPKISDRNWTFRAEISKTRIDRHVIFTDRNRMFLTTSQDSWQNIWYLIKIWWRP